MKFVPIALLALAMPVAFAQTAAPAPADPVARLVGQLDLEKYKATIKGLTQFGDRRQGTERNRKALDWIEAQLKSYGCTNIERMQYQFTEPAQAFAWPARNWAAAAAAPSARAAARCSAIACQPASIPIRCCSRDERIRALDAEPTPLGTSLREDVYCTKIGTTHPEEMYIVGAHMDGIGFGEAANDNGSGTALVMELARIFSAPGVQTDRSIRFALWNNEETGLNGARAYVEQRKDLQGIEAPKGSGKYPEPKWLGMIQHDMMLWDHGMPVPQLDAAGKPMLDAKGQALYVSPKDQRREADVNIEFQSNSKQADGSAQARVDPARGERQVRDQLSGGGRAAHDEYRFDAVHGLRAGDFAARERTRHADRLGLGSATGTSRATCSPPIPIKTSCSA